MPIASIVTRGYGSFGSIPHVVTRGYISGAAVDPPVVPPVSGGGGGSAGYGPRRGRNQKIVWRDDYEKAQKLAAEIKDKPKKEQKKIKKAAIKAVKAATSEISPILEAQRLVFDSEETARRIENMEAVLAAYYMLQFIRQEELDIEAMLLLGIL